MTDASFDQSGEGSAVECGSPPAATQCRVARGCTALVTTVQPVRASSIPVLEEAEQLDRPVEVTEASVPITLKVPPSTARLLRAYARSSDLTIGAIVTRALNMFLSSLRTHG